MKKTPKALRLHIGIFGRTNVGKSTFLNYITAQEVAITSPIPGTTTDVVEKALELLPLGPVLFIDTAGLDDQSALADLRLEKTEKIFDRMDICVLLLEANAWTPYEEKIVDTAHQKQVPVIAVVNKTDIQQPDEAFRTEIKTKVQALQEVSSIDPQRREEGIHVFKRHLIDLCPEDFLKPLPLVNDLIKPSGLIMLIVPIDLQAPKGRLILPQIQTIRDALDHDAAVMVVKEREYAYYLSQLKIKPDLVICDSQVVLKMIADTPEEILCTTFSILFARNKGNLAVFAEGAAALENLQPHDKVLISESCSHHPIQDDIGRVKIPRWIRQYIGGDLRFDVAAGKDFPRDLKPYQLIIHCGGCMTNRRGMLSRLEQAKEQQIPITNYGICISLLQGVLGRVLKPFPAARDAYLTAKKNKARL